MEENLVLLCTQVNRLERNVGKDIKLPVSKRNMFIGATTQIRAAYKDHEIHVTLKSCITLSFKFLDSQHKISIVL